MALLVMANVALVFALLTVFFSTSAGAPANLCTSGLGSSFTSAQKEALCKDHADNKAVASCAMEAKSKLSSVKFDDILALCAGVEKGSNPSAPAQCFSMYNSNTADKSNKAVGLELCGNATSGLPVECWRQVKSLIKDTPSVHTVKQQPPTVPELVDYCRHQVTTSSAVDCIEVATGVGFKLHHSTPLKDILDSCADTSTESATNHHISFSGDNQGMESAYTPPVHLLTPSFKHCLGGLFKHLGVEPSKPVRTKTSNMKLQFHKIDILQFCLYSSLTLSPASVHYLVSDENTTYPEGVSDTAYYSLQCFETLDKHLQQTVNSAPANQVVSRTMIGNICRGARNEHGAVSCTQAGLSTGPNKNNRGNTKLNGLQVEELCTSASGTGPIDCFFRSTSLMSRDKESVRLELCALANNTGPVDCFQTVNNCVRNPAMRNDENAKLLLCNGATSDAPAICACEAPTFLSDSEKILLCRGDINTLSLSLSSAHSPVPVSAHTRSNGDIMWARAPVECIKTVQASYMQFADAPPRLFDKATSTSSGTGADDSASTDKTNLLSFCSYGTSSFPMSSAHCFKNAPKNLHLADAIQMCTNATRVQDLSEIMTFGDDLEREKARAEKEKKRKGGKVTAEEEAAIELEKEKEKTARTQAAAAAEAGFGAGMSDDVVLNMKLCMKFLSPRGWSNHEIITLCSNNNQHEIDSRMHQMSINNLVKCGQHVHTRLLYSKLEAAHICNREVFSDLRKLSQEKGKVLTAPPKKTGGMDDSKGPVLTCADTAIPMPTATISASGGSGSIKRIPPVVLRDVCTSIAELHPDEDSNSVSGSHRHMATAVQAGQCLARLYGSSGSAILSQLQLLSPAPPTLHSGDNSPEAMQRIVNQQFADDAFSNPYIASLCGVSNYQSIWACMAVNPAKHPSREEVTHCLDDAVSVPSSVRVLRMYSVGDGDPELTAGKAFAIRFQIVDQYGVDITHSSLLVGHNSAGTGAGGSVSMDPYRVSLTINGNNIQGAVLWGISSNTTASAASGYDNGGTVEINSMIISQPGVVQVTLSTYVSADNFARMRLRDHGRGHTTVSLTNEEDERQRVILGRFQVAVKEDPAQKDSSFCMFVFKQSKCSAFRSEEEQEGDFPMTRHWLPPRYYMHVLVCDAMFQSWFVHPHLVIPTAVTTTVVASDSDSITKSISSTSSNSLSGIWIEHRIGIAAIWLGGVGGTLDPNLALPRIEQSFLERLGLEDPTSSQQLLQKPHQQGAKKAKSITKRDVKRAYYRKSIIWHPDKWINVQGVSSNSHSHSVHNDGSRDTSAVMTHMNPYTTTVQSVFELVSEAYRELNLQLDE